MMRRLLVAGLAGLALVAGPAAPAYAHNQLVDSDPADGATVEEAPQQVRLTFLASVDPDNAELAVTGPDGAPATTGAPAFDGTEVTVPVVAALAGDYRVDYRVLSTDGHWAEGAITFTVAVGEQASSSPSPSPSPSAAPSPTATVGSPAPVANVGTGDGSGLAWWVWLLVALVLAALAGYGIVRRRGSARGSAG